MTVATPASCLPIVAALAPEYMTLPIHETGDELDPDAVDQLLETARDVIAVGPGVGQGPAVRAFMRRLLDSAAVPLVIDADGLKARLRALLK